MSINNIIKYYFLEKPITSILYLVLICAFFKVVDIFILRLDEPPVNEIILSKTLGLLLLLWYLRSIHLGFREIGIHTSNILNNIIISLAYVILGLIIIYGGQFAYLHLKGVKPCLSFQHYSLITLIVSVIAGNIINALMEEGLFRGLMITQLLNHTTFFKANLIQAGIFGLWHIVWPLKDYYLGKVDSMGALLGMSFGNVIITFLMGFTMGCIFYKTGNLWTAFTWHFLMNLSQNMLIIKPGNLSVDAAIVNTSSTTLKGLLFILSFIIINLFIRCLPSLK